LRAPAFCWPYQGGAIELHLSRKVTLQVRPEEFPAPVRMEALMYRGMIILAMTLLHLASRESNARSRRMEISSS
jgi:hypothetical protein